MPNADISDEDADPPRGASMPIWVLASVPPPVNGQANCNKAMLAILARRSQPILLPLGTRLPGKIWRALANAMALLLYGRRGVVAYCSVPGQNGVWLLLPAMLAARLRGMAIWLHHHSFRSINLGPLAAMRALVVSAGQRQHHILLSDGMREQYARYYLRRQGDAFTISNTVLFPPSSGAQVSKRPDRPLTLGHMSVLTKDKGIAHLLRLFDNLRQTMPDLRLVIAGPSDDQDVLQMIDQAVAKHAPAIEYHGAVAAGEKEAFYQAIDAFILPTTLIDEAEPLVMIEAYAHGVDVFATATGCIPDRIRTTDNLLTLDIAADAARIARMVGLTGRDWEARRLSCIAYVQELAKAARVQGGAALDHMLEPYRVGCSTQGSAYRKTSP